MRCSFALAVAFGAASLVSAQTGSFSTYGAGCKGTGGNATCHSANMACGTGWSGGNTNVFATSFKVASTRVATGARLRSQNAGVFNIEIWKTDAAGKPTAQVGKSGTITIGALYANYSGIFPTPIPLPPGDYALVHNKLSGNSTHPICQGGVNSVHYWHPPSATSWNGPFTSVSWAFEVICLSNGAIPTISNAGVPKVNASFSVELKKAAGNATCALLIGATRTKLDLTGLGAPGCTWLATAHITLGAKADAAGMAATKIAVPNNVWLVNKILDFQWVVIDAGANRLGVALTAGGEATIGK